MVEVLVGHSEDQAVSRDSGIVDQDVQSLVIGGHRINQLAQGSRITDVADLRLGTAAVIRNLLRQFLERPFTSCDADYMVTILR